MNRLGFAYFQEALSADWANLPQPALVRIFSFLCALDRCRVGGTCRNWWDSLDNPALWKTLKCGFFFPVHGHVLKCVELYGKFINDLTIVLNQSQSKNRENALAIFSMLTQLDHIRLKSITVQFKGDNPLFYSGQEFIQALSSLFMKMSLQAYNHRSLRYLNFSEMQANLDASFISHITISSPQLEYLNILNKMIVCQVPECSIVDLVKKCTRLTELHLFYESLSDEVFSMFSQPGRQPFRKLGIVCRRADKYGIGISREAWTTLVSANPNLKVELGFDHTCPLFRISEILMPGIPVQELYFATFTRIASEMELARLYFNETLEVLVVNTKPDEEFEQALLALARSCKKLSTLYIYGVLKKEVVEEVLSLLPNVKTKGSYILRWEMDPEPWTVGEEDSDPEY